MLCLDEVVFCDDYATPQNISGLCYVLASSFDDYAILPGEKASALRMMAKSHWADACLVHVRSCLCIDSDHCLWERFRSACCRRELLESTRMSLRCCWKVVPNIGPPGGTDFGGEATVTALLRNALFLNLHCCPRSSWACHE